MGVGMKLMKKDAPYRQNRSSRMMKLLTGPCSLNKTNPAAKTIMFTQLP